MRVAGVREWMLIGEYTICGVAHLMWSLSGPAEPRRRVRVRAQRGTCHADLRELRVAHLPTERTHVQRS